MDNVQFLPLGSVVYLQGGNKKLLIIARGLVAKNGDGVVFFDYGGVPYPEGLTDDKMLYFQHSGITKVVFEGMRDDDDEATVNKINLFINEHPDIERGDVGQLADA